MSTKLETEMEESHYISIKKEKPRDFPPAAEVNVLSSRNQATLPYCLQLF